MYSLFKLLYLSQESTGNNLSTSTRQGKVCIHYVVIVVPYQEANAQQIVLCIAEKKKKKIESLKHINSVAKEFLLVQISVSWASHFSTGQCEVKVFPQFFSKFFFVVVEIMAWKYQSDKILTENGLVYND